MSVRVVLADDHPMYRYGVTAILEQSDEVHVAASVGDGEALLAAVAEHVPDVVVTDLSMPGLDGVTACRRLVALQPDVAILVLTMHEDDAHVFAALRAGARGYLVKGADGEEITRAVLAVAGGDAVYGGSVARRIVDFYAGGGHGLRGAAGLPGPDAAGEGGARAAGRGCRNHEIGRRLEMSEKTVRNHVSQILSKLQVPDRTAAALRARDAGLGG